MYISIECLRKYYAFLVAGSYCSVRTVRDRGRVTNDNSYQLAPNNFSNGLPFFLSQRGKIGEKKLTAPFTQEHLVGFRYS